MWVAAKLPRMVSSRTRAQTIARIVASTTDESVVCEHAHDWAIIVAGAKNVGETVFACALAKELSGHRPRSFGQGGIGAYVRLHR